MLNREERAYGRGVRLIEPDDPVAGVNLQSGILRRRGILSGFWRRRGISGWTLRRGTLEGEVARGDAHLRALRTEQIHEISPLGGVTLISRNHECVRRACASAVDHPLTFRDEILEKRPAVVCGVLERDERARL